MTKNQEIYHAKLERLVWEFVQFNYNPEEALINFKCKARVLLQKLRSERDTKVGERECNFNE